MSTQYTTPPPGHRFHNPENAPAPPDGWRYMLEAEARPDQNWFGKGVECKFWGEPRWIDDVPEDANAGSCKTWTYIVPAETPFDIPAEESAIVPDPGPAAFSPGDVVELAPRYSGEPHPDGWRAIVFGVDIRGVELIGVDKNGRPWRETFPPFMLTKV